MTDKYKIDEIKLTSAAEDDGDSNYFEINTYTEVKDSIDNENYFDYGDGAGKWLELSSMEVNDIIKTDTVANILNNSYKAYILYESE